MRFMTGVPVVLRFSRMWRSQFCLSIKLMFKLLLRRRTGMMANLRKMAVLE